MAVRSLLVLAALTCAAQADVYMHYPRGSNDRNCEKNVNRNNGDRLFDSQNNAKGGYACPRPRMEPRAPEFDSKSKMYYHPGSKMVVEWTNQHGCGTNPKTSCEIVIQYACEDTLDPSKKFRHKDQSNNVFIGSPRDGTPRDANDDATNTIPDNEESALTNTAETRRFGMHENIDFYKKCKERERNKGLYIADQNVRDKGTATRQNPNGNRRGLECPEERDYYPHWLPSPWLDVAVITSNPSRCSYYREESSNIKARGECMHAVDYFGSIGKVWNSPKWPTCNVGSVYPPRDMNAVTSGTTKLPSLQYDCENDGHIWVPVWWDAIHPKSIQALTELKSGDQKYGGAFSNEIHLGKALRQNDPKSNILFGAAKSGPIESCGLAEETGNYCGCPAGYAYVKAASGCVQGAKLDAVKLVGGNNSECRGECDTTLWTDVKKSCGGCKVLAGGFLNENATCSAYCAKQPGKPRCLGAWEDADSGTAGLETCAVKSEHTCDFAFETTDDAICECEGPEPANPANQNFRSLTTYFTPKKSGKYIWLLSRVDDATLYVNDEERLKSTRRVIDGGTNLTVTNEAGNVTYPLEFSGGNIIPTSWVGKEMDMDAGNQYKITATSSTGEGTRQVQIGIKTPEADGIPAQMTAPMLTKGASDDFYQTCSNAACDEDVSNHIPQLQATAQCQCRAWDPDSTAEFTHPNACMQPYDDPGSGPWCYCEAKASEGTSSGSSITGIVTFGDADKSWGDEGREDLATLHNGGSTRRDAEACNTVCFDTAGCVAWTFKANKCTLHSVVNELVGQLDERNTVSGKPVAGGAPRWSYCSPEFRPKTVAATTETKLASRELLSKGFEEDEEFDSAPVSRPKSDIRESEVNWSEFDDEQATPKSQKVDEKEWVDVSTEDMEKVPSSWVQEDCAECNKELKTVDCIDGHSSFARENQLGNARGTANPDDAIPHGVNANRYLWTVPDHINENCVVRLRYNISTSDYWAWNNKGTPMTDSRHNERRRRVNGAHSPVVQDPYLGIGDKPYESFLSLAVNTNQYGRTFQDRSYVFAIRERPEKVLKEDKIYNVNVRGKRGNIVQTFPAVEYDFIPNDLCLEVGDYVHFQWTGSDYNPQRNPNDAEGGGDSDDPNQARRADRSNIVDMDNLPKKQWKIDNKRDKGDPTEGVGYNGAGQRYALEPSGMGYFAGSIQDFSNLEDTYEGMFWTDDGKPDKDTIMKLAFLDQVASLAKQGRKCLSPMELATKAGRKDDAERHPRNCAKLNAAMDPYGQRHPYFDAGLVKMNKPGRFAFLGTRNNNFSNRNQAGYICVKKGEEGTCNVRKNGAKDGAAEATCEAARELDLQAAYKAEGLDGQYGTAGSTIDDSAAGHVVPQIFATVVAIVCTIASLW